MLFSTTSERYLHLAMGRMTAPLPRGRPLARRTGTARTNRLAC
jgi:hypothetical protein